MGNDESKRQASADQTPELKIAHQRFKHFRYIDKDDLIELTLEVDSEKEVKEWEAERKRAAGFEDAETLLLSVRHEFEGRGFCGNVGTVKIYFENFPYLFSEEIENRVAMEKHFEEEELWYLLYCLLSSARDFARLDTKIGDVRPYNIFINDEGQIKVASLLSFPHEKTNFEKTAFEKTPTYLAPEEVALIAQGTHQNTTNQVLSESFSIGLTMLHAALLYDPSSLYQPEKTFDSQQLVNKLNQWLNLHFTTDSETKTYSDLLKSIVTALCDPDPTTRTSSLHIEELLRPHLNQILHLKPFDHASVKFSTQQQQPKLQAQPPPQQKPFEQVYIPNPQPYQSQIVTQVVTQHPHNYASQPYPQNFQPPFPQQQMFLPQQIYRVPAIEPKINQYPEPSPRTFEVTDSARVASNPQSVRFNPQMVTEQEVRYFTADPRSNGHQQFFNKYASGQPQPAFTVPNNNYAPPIGTFVQPGNTFNIGSGLNQPVLSQPVAVTATSQYSYAGSTLPAVQAKPLAGDSDFLKKIDEQLQNSRRQFPS